MLCLSLTLIALSLSRADACFYFIHLQGRTVCFFRDPKQRLISAFWHSQHADGMPKPVWGALREKVQAIERNMSGYRRASGILQLQRATPAAILPEYRRAFGIYFRWPGIQVLQGQQDFHTRSTDYHNRGAQSAPFHCTVFLRRTLL